MVSTLSTDNNDTSYFNGEWVREASLGEGEMEEIYAQGHRFWYQLDLSSSEPLKEDHVRRTLNHLYRKTPNLAVTYGMREGKLWLKRGTDPNVDFEIVRSSTLGEVKELFHNFRFNDDAGPSVCARLLQRNVISAGEDEGEDLEPSFSHKYHLLFSMRHSLTDGTATMHVMGFLISLLNDVIAGKVVDDNQPLGNFDSGEQTWKLLQEKKRLLEFDSDLREQVEKEFKFKESTTPIVLKLSPKSSGGVMKTISLANVVDRATTSLFVQKCKQQNVTVNSAAAALANAAILDALVEHGIQQDSYLLQNFHTVNLRRYWEGDDSPRALGCHIGYPLVHNVDTPRNFTDNFWDYVKQMDSALKNDVTSGKILLSEAFKLLTGHTHPPESPNAPKHYEGDYVTSNMGDMTDVVTIGGDHVRITNVLRSTCVLVFDFPLLFNYHTFRGQFSLMLDYNSQVLESAVAAKIQSQVLKHMREQLK